MQLRTDRMRMRPLGVADTAHLVDLHADPLVRASLGPHDASSARDRLARFEEQWRDLGYGMFALEPAEGGFVGRCGFVHWPEMGEGGETEIGWVLLSAWWGRGLATEAAVASLRWLWSTQPSIDRVTAMMAPENTASAAVAERIGMRHERDDVFRGIAVNVYSTRRSVAVAGPA